MKKFSFAKKFLAFVLALTFSLEMMPLAETKGEEKVKAPVKYDVSQIIVKYKDNANKSKTKLKLGLATTTIVGTKKQIKSSNMEVIDVNSADKMQKALDELSKDDSVEYAAPNYKLTTYSYSDEPMFSQQWSLKNDGQTINGNTGVAGNDIDAESAWQLADGSDILVGVMDTGVNIGNDDLSSNIYTNPNEIADNGIDDDNNGYIDDVNGWNFSDKNANVYTSPEEDEHGTNVAGVIAAGANGDGTVGVAPKVKILPLKFIKEDTGYTSDAIEAIEYAKSMGVQVMDCSWGCTDYNLALKNEMENADMLFVCAAGNNSDGTVSYPAAFDLSNVISVGATDNQGNLASFSNGSQDIYAPGTDILTTNCDGSYTTVSGTSFSAAIVAGIGALVKQAVPSITPGELKLAIKNGYQSKSENALHISSASSAIDNALPLNFINDSDGRLSRAMEYAGKIITSDIAKILTLHQQWSELSGDEKSAVTKFFEITDDGMTKCQSSNLDLIDAIIAELAASRDNLTTDEVLSLWNAYNDSGTFDSEVNGLSDVIGRIQLSDDEKNGFLALMKENHKVIDIAKSFIISQAIGKPLADVISPSSDPCDPDALSYTEEEKTSFVDLVNTYHLNQQYIADYLTAQNMLPSQLAANALSWQQEHNFYIVSNTVTPYAATEPNTPGFNKYSVSNSGDWTYGNASIDKATGLLSYSQSLISLAGRNSLDLDFGLRFDSEMCDAVINAQDADRISYEYKVTENDQYYTTADVRSGSHDTTTTNYYYDDSQIASWEAVDSTAKNYTTISGTQYYYYRIITITAETNSSLNASGLGNYCDSSYQLGVGWAFDLPSLEIINSTKYIHLPGGGKYKITGSNKLDGYNLNTYTFGTATVSDFSVDGKSAAYQLDDLSGTKMFFDSTGKYLGVIDNYGNYISVYYNANGLISKIYDTADRHLDIGYSTTSGVGRTVTVTLVDSDGNTSKQLYTIHETYYGTLDSVAVNQYLLTSITNAVGKSISYDYHAYNSNVYFNGWSSIGTASTKTNSAVYLNGVTSATSAYTQFNYITGRLPYGPASLRDCKRVSSVYTAPYKGDANSGDYRNTANYIYTYYGPYWRYATNSIWPLNTSTQTVESDTGDVRVESTLNNQLRITDDTTFQDSTGEAVSQTQTVSVNAFGQPTQVDEKSYQFDSGTSAYSTANYTLKRTFYTWDSYGYGQNLCTKEKSGSVQNGTTTLNSYYDQLYTATYHVSNTIPDTETTYTTNDKNKYVSSDSADVYATKTSRSFLADTFKVYCDTVSTYDMTTGELYQDLYGDTYTYDGYGNLIKQVVLDYYQDAQTGTAETDYSYSDAKGYSVYPVSTTVKNVKDCDGNSLKKADGTTAADITTSAAYNMLGEQVSSTDGNGYKTSYTYDDAGNLIRTANPDGSASTTNYDYTNLTVTATSADGTGSKAVYGVFGDITDTYRLNSGGGYDQLTHSVYDSQGRLTSKTEYQTTDKTKYKITANTYDFAGNVTDSTVKDQNGNTLRQQSSQYSQSVLEGSALINTATSTASTGTDDNITSQNYSDALGRTTYSLRSGKTTYNQYQDYNTLSQSGYGSMISKYDKDSAGNASRTDNGTNDYTGDNVVSTNNYDGLGNLIESKDANGSTTRTHYDLLNRAVEVDTPFQNVNGQIDYTKTKTYYDAGGRVSEEKETNNAAGSAETYSDKKYTYDSMGRLLKTQQVIDATHSQYTQYYYDAKGKLRRVYTGLSSPLTINGLDNVATNGDTNYEVTKYDYDFYGRLTSVANGANNSTTYSYADLTGQLSKRTLANGAGIVYTYDTAGNVKGITATQTGKTTVSLWYTYDLAGNLLAAGDGSSTISYVYDGDGRCVEETDTFGATTYTKDYTYYIGVNFGIHYLDFYKNGSSLFEDDYGYYMTGQLETVTRITDTDSELLYMGYDDNGNIKHTYVQGHESDNNYRYIDSTYTYNLANLPLTYTYKIMNYQQGTSVSTQVEDYYYRLDGNMTRKLNDNSSGLSTTNYAYDAVGRLTSESYYATNIDDANTADWTDSYAYDDYDNIQTLSHSDSLTSSNSTSTSYAYDSANRLTDKKLKNSQGTVVDECAYDYDAAGSLLDKKDCGTTMMSYAYDALNRMSSSQPIGGTATAYAYDANSQRYGKTTGTKTTISVWSNGGIFYDDILNGGTQSSSQYLPGNMGVVKDGVLYSNAVDGQGDVVATLTNNTGDITDYNFDAYGNKTTSVALASPYGYRGYYQDSETGFYYLNARYYDPGTRQFTQEDTYAGNINSPETLNRYSYCAGNPVMYSDPSGHFLYNDIDNPYLGGYDDDQIQALMGPNYDINADLGNDPNWKAGPWSPDPLGMLKSPGELNSEDDGDLEVSGTDNIEIPGNLDPSDFPDMTPEEIANQAVENDPSLRIGGPYDNGTLKVFPKDNGRLEVIRIDPPDTSTPYWHVHLYNSAHQSLDAHGNIVSRTSPEAHMECLSPNGAIDEGIPLDDGGLPIDDGGIPDDDLPFVDGEIIE